MTAACGALLPLPGVDELLLTQAELTKLTGATQSRLQVDWLQANGWVFFLTRAGRPVVGRLYANLKLADVELSAIALRKPWSPNMRAISG